MLHTSSAIRVKKVFEPLAATVTTFDRGGGRGEIFEIVAENWWYRDS